MEPKARNNFVLVKRDEADESSGELWIPETGRVKPSTGTILSAGKLVKDPDIKGGKGKKCLFHPTVGFSIKYEGEEYLVLEGEQIIGMP